MPPTGGKNRDLWTKVGFYSSLGFVLPAATVVGYGFGWLLDQYFHASVERMFFEPVREEEPVVG